MTLHVPGINDFAVCFQMDTKQLFLRVHVIVILAVQYLVPVLTVVIANTSIYFKLK